MRRTKSLTHATASSIGGNMDFKIFCGLCVEGVLRMGIRALAGRLKQGGG